MVFNIYESVSYEPTGLGGLQLKFDILLCREDDNISNLERDGEDGTLRNELGESRLGRISDPIRPLQIFVLANVALALKAAPDKHEKLPFLGISLLDSTPFTAPLGIPLPPLLH
ncbi:hypothetical protein V6Z12_A09G271800 [Gossypium hirsutum]